MDLDNYREFPGIDPENMLAHIEGCQTSWVMPGSWGNRCPCRSGVGFSAS
jgi:hypothetical protein